MIITANFLVFLGFEVPIIYLRKNNFYFKKVDNLTTISYTILIQINGYVKKILKYLL